MREITVSIRTINERFLQIEFSLSTRKGPIRHGRRARTKRGLECSRARFLRPFTFNRIFNS